MEKRSIGCYTDPNHSASHGTHGIKRGGVMRFRILMLPAVLFLLMGIAATPRPGFAQGGVTATLSGTVLDSSGAIVPGATITAKNNATASARSAASGADGLFTIPALEPGNYT